MMYDRSPQRVVMSVKKKQVRYYHRVVTFRKTRSERTTRRKKKVRIKVDVSQPPQPYVEPKCCVKLAVHHRVAAYYTNYVLRCDTTCFCNELCDFVCGRRPGFNTEKTRTSAEAKDKNGVEKPNTEGRPKSMSCDSGFDESDDDQCSVPDSEFVNIDVGHQSVWFCRFSPPGPEDLKVVRSSLHQILSESATETECSGPSHKMCFRWHKDLQKSASSIKAKRKKAKDDPLGPAKSPNRQRRSKKSCAIPIIRRLTGRTQDDLEIHGENLRKVGRSSTLSSSWRYGSPAKDSLLKLSSDEDVVSDYDSSRETETERSSLLMDETYNSVLSAIRNTSLSNEDRGRERRSASFRVDVT